MRISEWSSDVCSSDLLYEGQRLFGHARMEQRIAAAVGIQPVAHILPGGDLVHGFVGDQLLEQRGRRVPVDGAQVEEAGVEPRQQQLAQVVVEALEIDRKSTRLNSSH